MGDLGAARASEKPALDATLTTALYTFQTAFGYGKLGYGAAMAIVVFAVVLMLTALAFRFVGRRVPYLGAES